MKESVNEATYDYPDWYNDMVISHTVELEKAIKDTKQHRGAFKKYETCADLAEFEASLVLYDFEQLIMQGEVDKEELMEEVALKHGNKPNQYENWCNSVDDENKFNGDEMLQMIEDYNKLGGFPAWYKLATGKNWE